MGSPEDAIEELVQGLDRDILQRVVERIDQFVGSEASEEERAAFLEEHTEIYFPPLGLTPLQWLQELREHLLAVVDG